MTEAGTGAVTFKGARDVAIEGRLCGNSGCEFTDIALPCKRAATPAEDGVPVTLIFGLGRTIVFGK